MRRLIALLFAVAGIAAAAGTPASATSIEFEYLLGTEVTLQQLDCNSEGTSSATFVVTGSAGGPHPGTFESTLTVTAGPLTYGEGALLEVNESFEIISGDTLITGTKHLVPREERIYPFLCTVAPSAECDEVSALAGASGDALRYEATITGPEGTREEEGYAEFHINADGFMCGGEMQFSWGYMEQFFSAAIPSREPATVTISPATAVNAVDAFHELTATVSDEGGQPVTGAIVRFSVVGTSSASGDCTTDGNGECTFSYQVAPFPGEDAITAYVDVDADGVQDAGEPTGTATKTIVLPTSTPGQTTGGGQFVKNQAGATGDVTFTLTARSDGATLQGGCTIVDKASGTTIKCLDVLAYVQHGRYATIFGHAEQDGLATLYRISVVDSGERGSGPADLVTITTAAGYVASGPVTNGDVQVR
jgi:Bacterial Ig-like domain (group 1)